MTELFVSYKAEDRPRVAPLVEALQEDGYSVWWDAEIGGGEEWRETICKHLDAAERVVVVWSKKSVGPHGNFVRDEATRALKRRAYLPVRIDKVDPPLGFGEMQSLDLVGWKGDRNDRKYKTLLAALRNERAAPSPASRKGLDRRTAIGGAATATAIAAVGGWALLRPKAANADSIAVLPFANLSGDPAQDYFSDGIAEELRSALARIAGLKVVGRTSSEAVRDEDAKAAARKLSVANILIGSVRRSPDLIRVNAQLLDGRNGIERWSDIYDRTPGDALDIQTDIAKNVANALSFNLAQGDASARLGGTSNPAAQDLYLKAMAMRQMGLSEDVYRQVVELFDRAIALDPKFASAYAQKSIIQTDLTGLFSDTPAGFAQGYAAAASSAKRAISLAPDLALGHAALADALAGLLDLRGADAEYRKAAINGENDPVVMTEYAFHLSHTGRPGEGLRAADRGVALDPLNPRAHAARSDCFFQLGRYAEAIRSTQKVTAVAKVVPALAYVRVGESYMLLGDVAKARESFERAPRDSLFRVTAEAILAARTGNRKASDEGLAWIEEHAGDSAIYQQAQILAQQKEVDAALSALERGMEVRDPGMVGVSGDHYLEPLRAEPRFKALETKLGYPL